MTGDKVLENYFQVFRENTIGRGQRFRFPSGEKEIIYADWTASARGYRPIEHALQREVLPFFANTHTETTITGTTMTKAYEEAKVIIKEHVNANQHDALIFCGSGMTAAVNKLQRLLGLRMPASCSRFGLNTKFEIEEAQRPVVFLTTMEHHSNHIAWLETIATVEIIGQTEEGNVDLKHFEVLLSAYRQRKNKIAAITACSNVTGIQTPYHEIARMIHAQGGVCFVDFAASAPYVNIDMHPEEEGAHLDAIYFSMHKFLGGPGTPGVLIFNQDLYSHNVAPDHPGGGTIQYSNPWKERDYVIDIEAREDGGTPPVLQGIKAAMCIRLKEAMGVKNILRREEELVAIAFSRLEQMHEVEVLQGDVKERLGIISFIVKDAHYNLIVKLLNDKFGIQTRGGCSCAGTYGHQLLKVDQRWSHKIRHAILAGDLSSKPGWIRVSLHPTMTDEEIEFIMDAIKSTVANLHEWARDYTFDPATNEYTISQKISSPENDVRDVFGVENYFVVSSKW